MKLAEGHSRATDFRYVYANTTTIGFGGTECQLSFGIHEPGDESSVEHQVAVVLTLPTVKLLGEAIALILSDFEEVAGPIQVDPAKLAPLRDIIEAAKAARAAAAKQDTPPAT